MWCHSLYCFSPTSLRSILFRKGARRDYVHVRCYLSYVQALRNSSGISSGVFGYSRLGYDSPMFYYNIYVIIRWSISELNAGSQFGLHIRLVFVGRRINYRVYTGSFAYTSSSGDLYPDKISKRILQLSNRNGFQSLLLLVALQCLFLIMYIRENRQHYVSRD